MNREGRGCRVRGSGFISDPYQCLSFVTFVVNVALEIDFLEYQFCALYGFVLICFFVFKVKTDVLFQSEEQDLLCGVKYTFCCGEYVFSPIQSEFSLDVRC